MGLAGAIQDFLAGRLDDHYDRDAWTRFVDRLTRGELVAFVGAGLSVRAGYPDWDGLLQALAQASEKRQLGRRKLHESIGRHGDRLWRADEYRLLLGEEQYHACLRGVFRKAPRRDACLEDLVRLPFRHVLTTNYDGTLRAADRRVRPKEPSREVNWADDVEVRRMLVRFQDRDCERHYVYLHGQIEKPSTVVLSDRDYTRQYLRSDQTARRLFSIFAMNRVAFFGFSVDDPDLATILRQVAAGVAGPEDPKHFAVVGYDPKRDDRAVQRRRFVSKFGVLPIFYDRRDRHAALATLLGELTEAVATAGSVTGAGPAAAGRARRARTGAPPVRRPATRIRKPVKPKHDPDDPQKGRFGGLAERNGRRLSARVRATSSPAWFEVTMEVRSTDPAKPLRGKVRFHLHDTFDPQVVTRSVVRGVARHEVECYGAFTVGAVADDGRTRLELDLASLDDPRPPLRFLES